MLLLNSSISALLGGCRPWAGLWLWAGGWAATCMGYGPTQIWPDPYGDYTTRLPSACPPFGPYGPYAPHVAACPGGAQVRTALGPGVLGRSRDVGLSHQSTAVLGPAWGGCRAGREALDWGTAGQHEYSEVRGIMGTLRGIMGTVMQHSSYSRGTLLHCPCVSNPCAFPLSPRGSPSSSGRWILPLRTHDHRPSPQHAMTQ